MQRTRYLTGGRGPGRLLGLLLALVTMIGVTSTAAFAAPAPKGPLPIRLPGAAASAADTVAAMQPSWNLGNTFDAIPDVTSWGNDVPTKSLFDALKAQGYRSVRIPVTWTDHQSATAPYAIDAAWMTSVKKAVDLALNDGLYVVINVHHDSWQWIADMPTNHDGVLARFKATWTQIAATFRNHPQKLLFEGNNEPQFTNTTEAQGIQYNAELNSAFRSVVRQSGGNNATRLLFLPTLGCTPSQERMDPLAAQLKSMNDPNLAATVHYYGYYPFSVNIAGGTRFDATSQQDMTDAFNRMRSLFVTQGIPTYLGEYGLLGGPDSNHPSRFEQGEALKYYEMLGHSARTAGVTTALWDAGSWNYFNRTTLQWSDPGLGAAIRSSWTTRSGTASSDRVYLAKAGAITARTLTLNPNGTTFRGLWQGSTQLVQGRDYTVSGNQLTLTASALTRLAGNRAYGTNATIQARFSAGVPWNIYVTSYDPPVLVNATGNTTDGLSIPTQFRGDQLATLESRYADGSTAGNTSWTPYQEFNVAFSPDYPHNAITLLPAYLNALNDGAQVTLTFHFWSGTTVTYRVTKNGGSVTGTVA